MDAKRLEHWEQHVNKEETIGINKHSAREILAYVRQQQAEIDRLSDDKRRITELNDANYARSCEYAGQLDRLNRAYEVLEDVLKIVYNDSMDASIVVKVDDALSTAQRIKEGNDQ